MFKSGVRHKLKSINWKQKFVAFGVHLGLSLLIFFVLLYFILFEWYPHPFFTTDGGTQGLRLIIFVDLILGPTLTFVVFNLKKPSLRLDLALIALMQFGALVYGTWVVHHERPVAVVFSDDRFNPIPYYQVIEAGIALDDLKQYGKQTPVKIYVELPEGNEQRAELFLRSYRTQQPVFLMGERYRKIDDEIRKNIAEQSIDMEKYLKEPYLLERSYLDLEQMQSTYHRFVSQSASPITDYLFLALFARHGNFIIVVDRKTLEFVDVLDIMPPQLTKYLVDTNTPQ